MSETADLTTVTLTDEEVYVIAEALADYWEGLVEAVRETLGCPGPDAIEKAERQLLTVQLHERFTELRSVDR